METGINHFIFISALLFGIGLYILLSGKEAVRVILGLSILFSASILNIAAFSGFWNFNPEGQIIIFIISIVCLLNIAAGIALFINHYRIFKTNKFEGINDIE
jgi:NADH-quinone oxidoreductase subunit K